MIKNFFLLVFLLMTSVAISQTTVTLEDQCNCEVLSGTDVTSPGMTTPTGADIGDVYVNTDTGTIYFWDGDSWELTSSDDQQLQDFSFDELTNQLTLQLENGGTVSVDVSTLQGDGNITSPNGTIIISGDANALLGDVEVDIISGGVDQVLVTDATGAVEWIDKSDFDAIADQVTITGLGTAADPFKVEDLAIVTDKLAADAVTNEKLADNAVQTENIVNGTILTEDIASGGNDQVLVTDATGAVEWIDKSDFDAIADQVTITGLGTAADPFKVEDLAIVTDKLAADAVTNDKLADNAVQTENIVNGTILTEDIASGGNDQVLVTDATGAVEWIDKSDFDAIADQVTITGLGTAADPFKVEDLAIVTDKLAADAVTNDKLADNAVQTENIVNGTILTEDISSGGNDQVLVTDATGAVEWIDKSDFDAIADQVTITGLGTVADPFKVEDLAIVTDKLAADAVTNDKLADNAVQTENIVNGTILTEDIASGGNDQVLVTDATGAVEWIDKSDFDAIADQVTITGLGTAADPFKVEDLAIVTDKLAADAVTNDKLADNAVQTENIVNGTILTEDIASGGNDQVLVTDATGAVEWIDKSDFDAIADQVTITGLGTVADPFKVEDLAIVTDKLAADAVTNDKLADNAVQTENIVNGTILTEDISSGGNDQVLVTDATGAVEWIDKSDFDAIADQVTITGLGTVADPFKVEDLAIVTDKLAADAVTNDKLADNAVQTENIVNGTILTEDISSGGNDRVLVTNAAGDVEWIDKATLVPATTVSNTSTVNTLSTTVDGVTGAGVAIINSNELSLDSNNELVSTINGEASTALDLEPTIVANQKTTSVVEGTGVNITNTTTGNNTEYTVTVDPTDIIGDGTISSTDIVVSGGANSTLNDVTLEIADNAITNAKMADNAITTTEILDGTIASADIADTAVTLEKLADGNSDGQVMRWNNTSSTWELVDLGSVTVTENDGIVGNEVTNATDGTLIRSGAGSEISPYTLGVATGGITTLEILDGTILTEDISSGGNDRVLVTNAAGDVEWIDKATLVPATTVSNTSTVNTLSTTVDGVTGAGVAIINSNELSLDSNNELVSTINGEASTALDLEPTIVANQKTTSVVEGTGVNITNTTTGNNTEYTVTVDPTDIIGDGTISSTDIVVSGGANSTLNDVTLEIADNAITNAKMADNAITTTEIVDGTIASADIAADAVNAATINADVAGAGLSQNTLTGALEVNEAAIADGTISSIDSTIDINGGDDSLFKDVTLDVADDAITTEKIAAGAVASSDIAADAVNAATINSDVAGAGLSQNTLTGALEVNEAAIADGTISSTDNTIDITGGDDSLFKDVTLDVADDAITTEKIAAGAVASSDIAADAVNAATINADVAGAGLSQNTLTGALEVNEAAIADGTISSTDNTIDITGGDDSLFKDVTLDVADDAITTEKIAAGAVASSDIAADAVNAATINADVAGAGLSQNTLTGALEVNEAAIADGTISSNDLTVTGGDDSVFKDVTLEITAGAVGTTELAADAVTNEKLADNAVQTENIVNGTILTEDISSGGNDRVLVTNAAGAVEWIDKATLVPATTVSNTSTVNTLSTTVDGVTGAGVAIINSNELSLDSNNELVSTINGEASTALDLEPTIVANQKTTSVVEGTGVNITNTTTGNNTEYTVTVDPTDIIGDGTISSTDIVVSGGANSTLNDVTLEIADNAITNAKMADNAITTTEIVDGTIASVDIANTAVTLEKLADGTFRRASNAMGWGNIHLDIS
ncbi:hypothetical protein M601_009590 [Cellulophaga baltica 4]|nr:hypothetical protein M601_009590 [Cellulophaga baltica 4]